METSKWNLPGWRIEQRYNNRVLIGNWNEERRQFQRGNCRSSSTSKTDFKEYKGIKADNTSRQLAELKNDVSIFISMIRILGRHVLFKAGCYEKEVKNKLNSE